ncbi:MAG: iron-containing alcohol dehydrogenase, partial [Actinomycetota bacterium]
DENEAGDNLARQIRELGIAAPFVLSSVHGKRLASRLEGPQPIETHAGGADQVWAAELGARAKRSGADVVVAIGGGRCIDVGKLAAARAGLGLVTVPTQLSHDGICSPVAVVPDESGRTESLGAVVPRAVFVSIPTLVDAPPDSLRAGLGDLLANPFALRDWKLAAEHGLDTLDQRSWDLSEQSFDLVEPYLDGDRLGSDPELFRRVADALVLSGMAMICAGTSRPASGGEHEISHAIDELFEGRALHGAQVAFGCIFSAALYGVDTGQFRARLRGLGLPDHPGDLGLGIDDTTRLLLAAPGTRPGRFTILEDADLDDSAARALIARIWDQT